jgi:hypothetical protein
MQAHQGQQQQQQGQQQPQGMRRWTLTKFK